MRINALRCGILAGLVCVVADRPLATANPPVASPASVLPNRPAQENSGGLLGEWFENKTAGISLRTPAGSSEIHKAGMPDLIVEFHDQEHDILVRVSKLELREPRPLGDYLEKKQSKDGVLRSVSKSISEEYRAEKLREQILKVGKYPMGVLAFRLQQGSRRTFHQQALIPVDQRFYYSITMTSPAAAAGAQQVDPKEKLAADTFKEMLESVELHDRTAIARDQEERLFRTRALLLEICEPKSVEKVLQAQQCLRLIQDGKDLGYSYVVEEKTTLDNRPGTLISVRSRTTPAPSVQVDVVSQMFISDDWKHESWSHLATSQNGKQKNTRSELGLSDLMEKDVLAENRTRAVKTPDGDVDEKQPVMQRIREHKLEVTTSLEAASGKPVTRDLPPWYLPQAARHLLPRLLASTEPKTYMFATYESEQGQLMSRYVDVQEQRDVSLAGKRFTAVPVKMRVGLEGAPTTYYVSPEGQFLGSETVYETNGRKSVVQVIPSDEKTLKDLWFNPYLSKPKAGEIPAMKRR